MATSSTRTHGPIKRWWLGFIQRRLNPFTLQMARAGRGPFSIVRHIGRKTGTTFEAPVILAEVPGGLIAELTYGPRVNWFRNVVAGGGSVLHRGQWYRIVGVESYPTDLGRRAFGRVPRVVLALLRRHDFRLLRVEPIPAPADAGPSARPERLLRPRRTIPPTSRRLRLDGGGQA